MLEIAKFVAELRAAFGETIDDAVARGKAGEETFFASDNGRTVGTRAVDHYNVWVADDSVHDRYYCKGCDGSCVGTLTRCSQRRQSNQKRSTDSCMQKRIDLLSTLTTTLKPESQTNLLCYLVATVAASYSLTNEWRVDHAVESCRIWLARNRVTLPWLKRVTLGQLALQIARRDLRAAGIAVRQSNVQSMFTNEMGVNTASTLVQRISAVCEAALRERSAI